MAKDLPHKISICPNCFNLLLKGQKSNVRKCNRCNYKPMIVFVKKDYIHNYIRLYKNKYINSLKGKHYKKIWINIKK